MSKQGVAVRGAVVAALLAAAAGTAVAVPAAQAGPGQAVSVTVGLTATDHAAVKRLAKHSRLPQQVRVRRLLQAAPARAVRTNVVAAARDHGLSVAGTNRFSVTAVGDPADVAAFAATERADADASYVVVNDRPGFFQRQSQVSGEMVRSAYHSPDGQAPSGVQPTVATIQFSGWDSADLSTYAAQYGLPDPVTTGQYTAVSVDGASPAVPDGSGGEGEVALDQEGILAAAPYLDQRAYFAPNTGSGGMVDALNQIATDAMDAQHDYYHLTAVSISYGSCELVWGDADLIALDDALHNVLAAGVTVFAASGDDAGYDCAYLGVNDPEVILPAAHPYVVGVGGTTLDLSGGSIDERAWFDPTDQSGSGGGVSTVYARPSYQKSAVDSPGRVVPDIALDADPQTGFAAAINGQWWAVGGTSLATPFAAATFSNLLASDDDPYGVGNILPNLYGAPSTSYRDIVQGGNAVYDATAGYDAVTGLGAPLWQQLHNSIIGSPTLTLPRYSRTRDVPLDITTPTGMRYSRWKAGVAPEPDGCSSGTTATRPSAVTAPKDGKVRIWIEGQTDFYCFTDSATTFVDSHDPAAKAHASLTGARAASFSWSGSDPAPSSGVSRYRVKVFRSGTSSAVYSRSFSTADSVVLKKLSRGHSYTVRVTAQDRAGNRSDVASAKVAVPRG